LKRPCRFLLGRFSFSSEGAVSQRRLLVFRRGNFGDEPDSKDKPFKAETSTAAVARYWERICGFEEGNRTAAKIILADVVKYGEATVGLVTWARMVLRHDSQRQAA
jgi:hypothetical protein